MTDSAPPRLAYTPPAVVTYTPESWQARLVAEVSRLHVQGKPRIVTVMCGDGPVRWFPSMPQGSK